MGNMESYIVEELVNHIGGNQYQIPLFFDKPIEIGKEMNDTIKRQRLLISEFLDIIVRIAQEALENDNKELLDILFSESIAGMDLEYHRKLPKGCWKKPVLYRTDQSLSGKIYEIQMPGSGWGDLVLIAKALERNGCQLPCSAKQFTEKYSNTIVRATQKETPRVFHMLDAASEPAGMRYLFTQTRPRLQYWGIDSEVRMHEIDFITAHSAASLTTSNYFKSYISMLKEEKIVFGIQPNLLFDQKAIYLLPFDRRTRSEFRDEIRGIFPFTTVVEEGGFFDEKDNFVDLVEFANRRKSQKRYFLKYGGTDLSRNWGSRSVFRLDSMSKRECANLLSKVSGLAKKGEVWLIQEDVSRCMGINISDDIKKILKEKMHMKISAFYGGDSVLGVKVMARKHFKVHGNTDTLVGLGV